MTGTEKPKRNPSRRSARPMRSAWLVRWHGTDDEDDRIKQPVVAILNYRRSAKEVRRFVEQIYITTTSSLAEQLQYAKNAKSNPYRAEFVRIQGERWEGHITCGHNPFLTACLVNNLHIDVDQDGNETLHWTQEQLPEKLGLGPDAPPRQTFARSASRLMQ